MRLGLTHRYASLPERFHAALPPTPVRDPRLVVFNRPLAAMLGLDVDVVERHAAQLFSGNEPPEDAKPVAMAYAGHQFGNFVPRLGDGRAILLGELRGKDGMLRDVHLKGSGLTPYSRGGDGRAALGPMLREYLVSEAMHALGIPTTRSLAVVTTGEAVLRERPLPGAVLTRIASSHIRVGTFQYFSARNDEDGLRQLLDFVIDRHYPDARDTANPALAVLRAVCNRQATLLADWLGVGFIHGVMNTDNMALSGETIDFGPCAFLDTYSPDTVFSSIDHRGRYAYANQPAVAQWNLSRLAETLLPLLDPDRDHAIALAEDAIQEFVNICETRLQARMRAKIGLVTADPEDHTLVNRLLAAMQESAADFTLTFRRLADAAEDVHVQVPGIEGWLPTWRARLQLESQQPRNRAAAMRRVNPAFIARNHRVEAALKAASQDGNFSPFERLLTILRQPYDEQPDALEYARAPTHPERVLNTFCGT
jgi:uncharacterized protein YdiU (UPF0061 family)